VDPDRRAELLEVIAGGSAILFTGAGFSVAARDRSDHPMPDGERMRRELWRIVFSEAEEPDASSLQDLFDVALAHHRAELIRYLDTRLRLGERELSPHYAAWFAAPWHKIYTLNVDDLASVVAERCSLPRPLAIRSSLRDPTRCDDGLEVIHLNGRVADGPEHITFSTLQYAARLCRREQDYEALANDLEQHPFVFVGTTLDEVILWQHVELRRRAERPTTRHPTFLVARTLTRARQRLLEDLGMVWIRASAEELASSLPSR